jgi:hypothetical protein
LTKSPFGENTRGLTETSRMKDGVASILIGFGSTIVLCAFARWTRGR